MGEDKKADKKRKRIVPKAPVQMIISREYVGTQTVTEAFIPIISEDIRKKIAEGDTFDNEGLSAYGGTKIWITKRSSGTNSTYAEIFWTSC